MSITNGGTLKTPATMVADNLTNRSSHCLRLTDTSNGHHLRRKGHICQFAFRRPQSPFQFFASPYRSPVGEISDYPLPPIGAWERDAHGKGTKCVKIL